MNIITGYTGQPHITAQQDREINMGIVGKPTNRALLMDVGHNMEAQIISANEVRVLDGLVVFQGCAASIDYGAYETLAISNGTQGMLRKDLICVQYERDSDTNVESMSLVVIEGTPAASNPTTPSYTQGNIQSGALLAQTPLYIVNIDGISIDSVTALYEEMPSLYDLGSTHMGAWKVASSNSTGTAVSYDINLTPGIWFLGIITPSCSAAIPYYFTNISSVWTYPYFTLGTGGSAWVPIRVESNITTHAATGASTSVTYTNTDRGRIFAVRIGR